MGDFEWNGTGFRSVQRLGFRFGIARVQGILAGCVPICTILIKGGDPRSRPRSQAVGEEGKRIPRNGKKQPPIHPPSVDPLSPVTRSALAVAGRPKIEDKKDVRINGYFYPGARPPARCEAHPLPAGRGGAVSGSTAVWRWPDRFWKPCPDRVSWGRAVLAR